MRGSLLPAQAMRVRAYICVCIHMEAMPTQKVTKKESVFSEREKKNDTHIHEGRLASVYFLSPFLPPPHSIGRLIFYSGRSRICIRSGVPFPSFSLCLSFFRDVCICLGHNTDDTVVGKRKVHTVPTRISILILVKETPLRVSDII